MKICCVVKADAYGHGAVKISRLLEEQADYFAVAAFEEAAELRRAGIKKPVLVLSYSSPAQYAAMLEYDIMPTIYNFDEGRLLSKKAVTLGKTAFFHAAVETGMGRIGFSDTEESADALRELSSLPNLKLEGLFSHYARADEKDKASAEGQTKRFDRFISLLSQRGIEVPVKHILNSAGIFDFDKQYDMVRMGVSLYGLYPSEEVNRGDIGLIPAMQVISHVIHVKKIPAGTGIGYGHTYVSQSERTIATVSIGYADGFRRCLTNKGYVLINGKKAPVTGSVCMDLIMADVTDIPSVKVGGRAVILGKDGGEEITAERLGSLCHSFNYEVVCSFMPRVKRIYYLNGQEVK